MNACNNDIGTFEKKFEFQFSQGNFLKIISGFIFLFIYLK